MKVVILSKAHVVGVYQRKLEELARLPDVELLALTPPYWREARVGVQRLERRHTEGYRLAVVPMLFNGHHHVHVYRKLWRHFRAFRPDIVHVDDEPYNLVTLHAALLARLAGAKVVFFTWQNLDRGYPPPFHQLEWSNYRLAAAAVAGNQEAVEVLRHKGYRGPVEVIPQFGVDPEFYAPGPAHTGKTPLIGFVGRLVPEKGVADLLEAFARMGQPARLDLVGTGNEQARLDAQAGRLGLRDRVRFRGAVPPAEMPDVYRSFDLLVVPSRTRPNWKEQFGRVIIEAMACGVPVLGSDSGEIPHVIGAPELVFPEGDSDALARLLDELAADPARRARLGEWARRRVQAEFTQASVARRYYELYRRVLGLDQTVDAGRWISGRIDGDS